MSPSLVQIVIHAIREKYQTEKAFYAEKLGISPQSWDRWKKGEQGLKFENIQIISTLFTDYEWMLVQKVVRNAEIISDVATNPVGEYLYLKYQIAKTWVNHGMVRLEWHQSENPDSQQNTMILQLIADYQFWGYNDIIEIRLPGVLRQQIETDQVKLLQWFDDQSDRVRDNRENIK